MRVFDYIKGICATGCIYPDIGCNFMRILLTTLILTLTLTISCQDRQDIKVTGQIRDELTGAPIPNAEVVVLCWYTHDIDDASFKKETLTTDSSGNFTASFDEGHQVDVASQAMRFLPTRKYTKLESNEINVDLRLKRDSTFKSKINLEDFLVDFRYR